jgi:hypothetical protein
LHIGVDQRCSENTLQLIDSSMGLPKVFSSSRVAGLPATLGSSAANMDVLSRRLTRINADKPKPAGGRRLSRNK